MSFRCERHNQNFNSAKELDDHIVRTHDLPQNTSAKQIKAALDRNKKSNSRIIGKAIRGSQEKREKSKSQK